MEVFFRKDGTVIAVGRHDGFAGGPEALAPGAGCGIPFVFFHYKGFCLVGWSFGVCVVGGFLGGFDVASGLLLEIEEVEVEAEGESDHHSGEDDVA